MKKLSFLLTAAVLGFIALTAFVGFKSSTPSSTSYGEVIIGNHIMKSENLNVDKYGALAIDRSNGFYYGWSYDYSTLEKAEQKAIEECNKKGGNCVVVLSYSGTGCAAYRTIDGNVGTAFGWGLAKTKEEADIIATKECLKRSNGQTPANFVWSCNSGNKDTLIEIKNVINEIEFPVKIGNQILLSRNLNVSTFRNGDPILEANTKEKWDSAYYNKIPAWCYYENNPANGSKYGKLYNWYAVIDPKGLAPNGWHIPSDEEWTRLAKYLGGNEYAGKKMKSTSGWLIGLGNGTNESGFNGLPSGGYNTSPGLYFDGIGRSTCFWSTTIDGQFSIRIYSLSTFSDELYRGANNKRNGNPVRCIKD